MRIAIVLNSSWNIYNFRQGLVKSLVEAGHQVIAIAPKDNYSDYLLEMGCEYHPISLENKGSNPIKDFSYMLSLFKIYRKTKPDLILQFTIKPNIYGTFAASFLKIPVVNNVCGLGTVFLREGISSKIAKILYKIAFRFPHQVFFQNEDDLNVFLENRLIKENITGLLPGSGVPLKKFKPVDFHRNKTFTFLMVSRLIYDKGIIEYIKAAKILKQKGIQAKFQVLGKYDNQDRLSVKSHQIKEWEQKGWIEYLGTSDNVAEVIKQADCAVLPSYREGTPRALLEAASMGKPIVTTDSPGCRQTVEDGVNGFLCEVQNAEDLAKKMEKMYSLSDIELKHMGKKSRQKVEKEFDERIVVNEYYQLVRSIYLSSLSPIVQKIPA